MAKAPGSSGITDISNEISFIATGADTRITISTVNALWVGFNNVEPYYPTVVDLGPSGPGAPEPSTWAMMALGFAGLGFASFRASRKSAALAA